MRRVIVNFARVNDCRLTSLCFYSIAAGPRASLFAVTGNAKSDDLTIGDVLIVEGNITTTGKAFDAYGGSDFVVICKGAIVPGYVIFGTANTTDTVGCDTVLATCGNACHRSELYVAGALGYQYGTGPYPVTIRVYGTGSFTSKHTDLCSLRGACHPVIIDQGATINGDVCGRNSEVGGTHYMGRGCV